MSLKPIIEENKIPNQRPLFWHYPHYGNQGGDPSSMIREGDWKLIYYYETSSSELYNLKNDPFENKNLAKQKLELTKKLSIKLKNWLVTVDAKYPTRDSFFNQLRRNIYDDGVRNNKLSNLEKQRLKLLSKDFLPNKNWWGSKTTKD